MRQALRTLRTQPGFAVAAVLMLALGIGATTAMFTVLKAVLIDPLPYPNADRLLQIVHNIGGIDQAYFNDAIFLTYDESAEAFDSVGAWSPESTAVTITGSGEPEEARALSASRGLLATLGVQPAIGRWFTADEDAPGSADVAMIGAGYWQRKFGGDPDVVGRSLNINGRPYQIVGVMPAHFNFSGAFDILLPLRINAARPVPFFYLNGIARMKPGATIEMAKADMARIFELYFDKYKANPKRAVRWLPIPVPLKETVIGDAGSTLWVLMATIAIVLLMACANVATLLLVRAESRRQEFAIRAALGAHWTRMARSLLVESMLLAMIGGALGLAISYGGLRVLVAVDPANVPRLGEITIDPTVIAFAIGITVLSGLLFGLMPIAKYFGQRLGAIGVGTRGISITRERQRSQHTLVAVQIALALVLLVGSGLMIRTFQQLRNVPAGFTSPWTLQTFKISISPNVTTDLDRVLRTQRNIMERISALPGISSIAFTTRLPMDTDERWSMALTLEDQPHDPSRGAPPNRQVKVISPGSFATFGTPMIAGRDFTWEDLEQVRDVAIVSESLAREMWGSASAALGKRIRQFYASQEAPFREIVGVAGDVYDDGVHEEAPATVYWPARLPSPLFGGYQPRRVAMVIRTDRAGTASLLAELRDAVRSVHGDLPLAQPLVLEHYYDRSMSRTTFTLAMLAIAGAMALLLGMGGVYGVIAYAVAQRRREIGIRMALGAQAGHIRALFLRRGLIVAAAGLALGIAGAIAFTRLMTSVLFGVDPLDPVTFAAAPLLLGAIAIIATYVPSQRALSVDPVETMRAE